MSSRLLIHRAVAAVVTMLVASAFASTCVAADPPSITGLASRNSLSVDDRGKIEEYATTYAARLLEATDAATVKRIRSKLVDVIRRGGTSEVFRDTYSRHALPGLKTVIAEGTADQSVTALVVVSQLGTEQALSTLVEACMPSDEPRRHVRLSAARGCGALLAAAGKSVSTAKITAAARGLTAASEKEPDPYTLRHDVQAIHVASEATEDVKARRQMHTYLVQAIETTAERAAKAEDADAVELLAAIYPVLHRLRTKFIVMDRPTQKELGKALGPCVRKVLDVATAHWSEFQEGKAKQPANIIAVCERFLATIDRVVRGEGARPPEERLKEAWEKNDIQRYTDVLKRWSDVLSRPPY